MKMKMNMKMKIKFIRAKNGETLDLIAYRENIRVEAVIKYNPHLAHKVYLSPKDKITIPLEEVNKKEDQTLRRLFG
jgi:LysM repeat protein